jgi:Tfp pilus assembly protein PilZ
MAKSSRRVHARYPCDVPVEVFSPVSAKKLADGRLLDLSMGGGSLETVLRLQKGVLYELRLDWLGQPMKLPARVAWVAPVAAKATARRFGMSFNLTTAQESVLKLIVDRLRTEQFPQDRGIARDYWSV